MTERERWIVYPLLFLALGASLRDKLVDRTTTRSIVCQELTVVDEEPIGNQPVRILAKIGRNVPPSGPPTGYLVVNGQVNVAGVINAKQYAYNGVPIVPALPSGIMGIPLDLLRAMQQAAERGQGNNNPNANAPQTNPSDQTPPADPLADPAPNR